MTDVKIRLNGETVAEDALAALPLEINELIKRLPAMDRSNVGLTLKLVVDDPDDSNVREANAEIEFSALYRNVSYEDAVKLEAIGGESLGAVIKGLCALGAEKVEEKRKKRV